MPGSKEDISRNNAFSLYDLYSNALAEEPLTGGGGVMKFTILVELSFVIITIHLVCIDHAPE